MSFLNSVLSSIGGTGTPASVTSANPSSKNVESSRPVTGATQQTVTVKSTTVKTAPGSANQVLAVAGSVNSWDLKRKAEDTKAPRAAKHPRLESTTPASSSNGTLPARPRPIAPVASVAGAARPLSRPGTPSASTGLASVSPAQRKQLFGPPSTVKPATSTTVNRPAPSGPATAPAQVAASKGPAKGSYKEIMERAAAARAAQAEFGQIKHKTDAPAPKLSRRALAAQGVATSAVRPGQKGKIGAQAAVVGKVHGKGNIAARPPVKGLPQPVEEKKKKVPVDLGYKGTMRPKVGENGYKGTMQSKPAAAPARPPPQASRSLVPKRPPDVGIGGKGYTYASGSEDEEDEEEEEEEYDDESDGMEGGGFDELMAEEEESERIAKKEDLQAQKELDALGRAKAERRKKLEQLAARRK